MKKIIGYLIVIGSLVALAGCTNDDKALTNRGYLQLGVENDVTLQTKSSDAVSLDVTILDASENPVKQLTGFDPAQNDRIELEAGVYTVIVTSGKQDSAAWETPFFYGKEQCRIVAGQVSDLQVICKIANTKVTVDYSESFKTYFPEYTATVSNSSGSLTYQKGETRGGYFAAEKLTAWLSLTNTDGRTFELKRVFSNIEEKTHYNLKFTLEEGDGSNNAGGNFDITVDEDADMILIRIPIVADDLEKMQVPVFRLEGFADDHSLVVKSGEATENRVKVIAPNGVETFRVSVQSDSLNAKGITSFDLVNLGAVEQALLEEISFLVPATVKDATDTLTFDLTAMANTLVPYDDRIQVHTFSFIVLDKMHQEKTVTFSYQVKPNAGVFTAEMTPASVWTTFARFSAVTDNQTDLGFKYKEADATEWTEIAVSSKNADNSFGCLVNNLKPHTKYVYYGFSNNDMEGSSGRIEGNMVEFTTDFANADENGNPFVPNLGFDDWYSGSVKYPNKTSEIYWDSGNTGAKLGSRTPTDETSDTRTGTGKAAYLKSQYVGVGGPLGKFAAGNLYSGVFDEVLGMSGAKINMGQPFNGGRPTKLKGWYKYTSGSIDYSELDYVSKKVPDTCHIYVAFFNDWTSRFQVNTKEGTFVDKSKAIGFGEFFTATSVDQYTEFDIDIKYKESGLDTKPTYILIVMTASKYGDYFTGSTNSVLYVDDCELEYDYNPASFVGTSLEGRQPANTNN
ncbi:MAG: PCMD domain-containing protein [Parabacteroides sp.]|nr:PCMD domain-containing protein [Parabacteroides sp.]